MKMNKTKLTGFGSCIILLVLFSLQSIAQEKNQKAKYIFLFIGDGMGINQAMITNEYLKLKGEDVLSFTQFSNIAVTTTHCTDSNKITDSAAAGTAISTGRKTNSTVIAMDTLSGEKYTNITEIARKNGLKTGIISSVALNHATPAAFYAKQKTRYMYKAIANEMPLSQVDYFAGGGIISENKDEFSEIIKALKLNNYSVLTDRKKYSRNENYGEKIYYSVTSELSSDASVPYKIDRKKNYVALKDYVEFGIRFLDNPDGFFIMTEGGKIDWSSHGNDAATTIHEVIDFEEAVNVALEFYSKHSNETLIIVTADHETGGMSLGADEMHYNTDLLKLDNQKKSKGEFTVLLNNSKPSKFSKLTEEYFSLKIGEELLLKDEVNEISKKLVALTNTSSGISWTTTAHTGMPVLTYAKGVKSELVHGMIDNTYLIEIIKAAAGWKN